MGLEVGVDEYELLEVLDEAAEVGAVGGEEVAEEERGAPGELCGDGVLRGADLSRWIEQSLGSYACGGHGGGRKSAESEKRRRSWGAVRECGP